jgi:hypothetical protein
MSFFKAPIDSMDMFMIFMFLFTLVSCIGIIWSFKNGDKG